MILTESKIGDIVVIRIVDNPAAATLELHDDFYTFYWRCRFSAVDFMNEVPLSGHEREFTTVTLTTDLGNTETYSYREAQRTISFSAQARSSWPWTVIRIDADTSSWAWQYAPDDLDPAQSAAPPRAGFMTYAGCASTEGHLATFGAALEFLQTSAIGSSTLNQHVDLFFRYLWLWERAL